MTHDEFMARYFKDEQGAKQYLLDAINDPEAPVSELMQACEDVCEFLADLHSEPYIGRPGLMSALEEYANPQNWHSASGAFESKRVFADVDCVLQNKHGYEVAQRALAGQTKL